jgi:hypothetical protein
MLLTELPKDNITWMGRKKVNEGSASTGCSVIILDPFRSMATTSCFCECSMATIQTNNFLHPHMKSHERKMILNHPNSTHTNHEKSYQMQSFLEEGEQYMTGNSLNILLFIHHPNAYDCLFSWVVADTLLKRDEMQYKCRWVLLTYMR